MNFIRGLNTIRNSWLQISLKMFLSWLTDTNWHQCFWHVIQLLTVSYRKFEYQTQFHYRLVCRFVSCQILFILTVSTSNWFKPAQTSLNLAISSPMFWLNHQVDFGSVKVSFSSEPYFVGRFDRFSPIWTQEVCCQSKLKLGLFSVNDLTCSFLCNMLLPPDCERRQPFILSASAAISAAIVDKYIYIYKYHVGIRWNPWRLSNKS